MICASASVATFATPTTTVAPRSAAHRTHDGEEWRHGWHARARTCGDGGSVLIVGAGPAGLEAAHVLGERGYTVALADAAAEPGGRVTLESRLPGLAEWARVRDYRLGQIKGVPNVSVFLGAPCRRQRCANSARIMF